MELDLTDKKICRLLGKPYWYLALYTDVSFTDKDLDYLLNTIKRHPCHELIEKNYYIHTRKYSSLEIANTKSIK